LEIRRQEAEIKRQHMEIKRQEMEARRQKAQSKAGFEAPVPAQTRVDAGSCPGAARKDGEAAERTKKPETIQETRGGSGTFPMNAPTPTAQHNGPPGAPAAPSSRSPENISGDATSVRGG